MMIPNCFSQQYRYLVTSLSRFLICGFDSMTDAFEGAGDAADFASLLISCGPALKTPREGAGPRTAGVAARRGRGIGGNLAPEGRAPMRAGGIPGGGPGGIRSAGRPGGGPGGRRTPGGGTPGRIIMPGGCKSEIKFNIIKASNVASKRCLQVSIFVKS